ncbi:MAG: GntR family transcriptional regulator [Pseudomonadota bacterium]
MQPRADDTQIQRQPLHALVASRVRDMIIEGQLAPGDQVNESRLCVDLGVSRTPMREAIRSLAVEGLIVLRPGRSTIVRAFTPEEVQDMLTVIAELEAMAGRQACETATDAQIAEIVAVHDQMVRHYDARERLDYYKLNQTIHSMIVAASGSPTLSELHGVLQGRMKRIRFIGHNAPANWQGAVAEHEEMIAALVRRDAAVLAEVLRRHIRNTWSRVEPSL